MTTRTYTATATITLDSDFRGSSTSRHDVLAILEEAERDAGENFLGTELRFTGITETVPA